MTGRSLLIISMVALTACSGAGETLSRLNPLTLFGDDKDSEAAQASGSTDENSPSRAELPVIDDGRTDIARVISARLDYTQSGVIVHATGEPPTIGYHSARLEPINFGLPDGNGTVWYEFRVMAPSSQQPEGSAAERRMSVGSFIPHSRLRNVQAVAIAAAQNDVTIRVR